MKTYRQYKLQRILQTTKKNNKVRRAIFRAINRDVEAGRIIRLVIDGILTRDPY